MSKKIIAILLALSFVFAFAACTAKEETPTTTAPVETTEDIFAQGETETPVVDVTEAPVEGTEAPVEGETAVSEEATTEAANAMPQTKEEIVNYFNTASNGVKTNATKVTRKYSKISLNGKSTFPSAINGILKLLGGADEFLGDQLAKNSKGEETYTGAQIKAVYPVEGESYVSKLTAADVSKATCVEKDGKWVITVTTIADSKSDSIKHGQGHAPKAFNVVLPGVVNDNIPGVAKSMVGTAKMDYPASTCKITVDPATGRVLEADYDLKWTINFDDAGVIIPFTTNDLFIITY